MMTNFTSRFSASAIAEACDSDRRGEILLPIADVSHATALPKPSIWRPRET
jgi:hypothetical protein